MGFGALSLAHLLGVDSQSAAASEFASPLLPKRPHFPVKARAVIHLFASGGPSHVDTWDPKPMLNKYHNTALPGMEGLAFGSPFRFTRSGQSGIETSEVFPKLAEVVDELAVVRSLQSDFPAHGPAAQLMLTGSTRLPKPSLGSWVLYGLGTENQNMPGFISIGGSAEWCQSVFLPAPYQGCSINYSSNMDLDDVILNIRNEFTPAFRQRRQLDYLRGLNERHSAALHRDSQLEGRLQSFELAFRMQAEATDAFDIRSEPKPVKEAYGKTEMGAKLLVARRLVERGVRFVQVAVGGWDHHGNLEKSLPRTAQLIDGPAAALIADLKQRGLLESTLVIWGGEFGRSVTRDRNGDEGAGRDHNAQAGVAWLAGGGIKRGMTYGATDELGARAVENKVHIHDLHATILALLGFDHTKLTYRSNGRDFRLTDNEGKVVTSLIA